MGQHTCAGPDGSSLLGFLASMGAFAALNRAWPDRNVRLSWKKEGKWNPVLQVDGPSSEDDIIDALYNELKKREINIIDENGKPAINTNKLTVITFRQQAEKLVCQASTNNRLDVDFLAAMAGEVEKRDGYLEDTALRTMSGSGGQNFLETMRVLVKRVGRDDIAEALFKPWRAKEARNMSLRYDPIEDRRYALRATDPSRESTVVSFPGANRLAVEALEYFPTFPKWKGLLTTGFAEKDIYWPIWSTPISTTTLRSLLLNGQIYNPERPESKAILRSIGVVAVFASSRISTGKYSRNFTPAKCLFRALV
jgi:hypothetical protein